MRIWLVESGEPLPIDENSERLWRIGLLADHLWRRGHDIVWWAGTFDHIHKTYRASGFRRVDFRERYSFRLLHGRPYRRTVSIARLINHRQVASEFARATIKEAKPDGVVCCVPTLELAEAVVEYGTRQSVPVILDYRDLWPEVFVEPFPVPLRPVVRALSYPWFRKAQIAFSGATAITGITNAFVERALAFGRRKPNPNLDRSFPHGYPGQPVGSRKLADAIQFWAGLGIREKNAQFVVCFFGNLSRRPELQTVIRSVQALVADGHAVKLVLCGKGELEQSCRIWAANSEAILLPGFVDMSKIQALMQLSHAGILPYPSAPDFAASIPNKVIEYFSGGLPVLSSVQGVVSDLLDSEQVGLTYANNNPASLVDVISKYLYDPDLHRLHSANAARLFERRFSADKVYSAMADHIEQVVRIGRC